MKLVCEVCGYEYDGGGDMPEDFECPECGVGKDQFLIK